MAHAHAIPATSKLRAGVFLSLLILIVEVAGGLLAHSLALLADAGHVLVDVIALGLSWYGLRQAQREPTQRYTFGFHRVGVLVAIVNAMTIMAVAVVILYEALQRFQSPVAVNSLLMTVVAVVGLAVNVFVALWLRGESRANLNVKSAFWHAASDALSSVGVIMGGVIIAVTGLNVVDPIVSLVISLIIVVAAWDIFRDGLRVLLEAVPSHIDTGELIASLQSVSGVEQVHDVHIWSLTPEISAMSTHIQVEGQAVGRLDAVRQSIEALLRQKYGITHTTIQMECRGCGDGAAGCQLCLKPEAEHEH
jgi:cobalt-zinc-cadmium efflux system protein